MLSCFVMVLKCDIKQYSLLSYIIKPSFYLKILKLFEEIELIEITGTKKRVAILKRQPFYSFLESII